MTPTSQLVADAERLLALISAAQDMLARYPRDTQRYEYIAKDAQAGLDGCVNSAESATEFAAEDHELSVLAEELARPADWTLAA